MNSYLRAMWIGLLLTLPVDSHSGANADGNGRVPALHRHYQTVPVATPAAGAEKPDMSMAVAASATNEVFDFIPVLPESEKADKRVDQLGQAEKCANGG